MPAEILVDTSVWIDLFDGKLAAIEADLSQRVRARKVAIVGQVAAELLQGARSKKEQQVLLEGFAGLEWIEIDRRTWLAAGELSAETRAAGKTVNLGDCVIAAAAKLNQCKVLTRDKDFTRLKGVEVELI